jgi:transglutaminase-like putative cysteine protease
MPNQRIFGTIEMNQNALHARAQTHHDTVSTASWGTRIISLTLIAGMLNLISLPAQAAAIETARKAAQQPTSHSTDDAYTQISEAITLGSVRKDAIVQANKTGRSIHKVEWYNNLWQKVTELFTDSQEEIAQQAQDQHTIDSVLALHVSSMQDHATLMHELEQQAKQMRARGTSAEIMQRHQQLIADLHQRYTILQGLISQLATAKQQDSDAGQAQALKALEQQIQVWQPARAHTNMDRLPWGTPDNNVRQPINAPAGSDFKPATFTPQRHHTSAIGQWRDTEYKIGQYLQQRYPLQRTAAPLSGMSSAGEWPVLKALPATVQEADLAANEDVQINAEIEGLAKSLSYNPAKIYKWVYDNIEYVPSYGSIQGSIYTLHTKRGNAFDTASLLISLLRASKVPARYVYGTVDIPAQTALDWVGGVNNIDAAQNLLGQGGVPNMALMSGSQVVKLRLEHVWVEANIAMLPARGGKANLNPDGTAAYSDSTSQPDSQWVPLDASYKQHVRTAGIDLAKAVPFDAQKLLTEVQASATVNDTEGSVKNIDQSKVDAAISQYQQQIQTYLTQNAPNATVGDILGKSEIAPYQSKMLSPVLPYVVNTVISDYQTVPDSMRHYFKINIYTDAYSRQNAIGLGEDPSYSVKIPTTRLQGQSLALSFKPTSQADEDAIVNSLPKPHADGSPITADEFPKALPSSIRLTPEVSLAGQILKSEGSYQFGSNLAVDMGYISPNKTDSLASKIIHVGEYHAIGYDMQGLSQQQLEATKAQLEQTKTKLASQQQAQLQGLTKHDITGAILQAGVQSYFALNDAQDRIAQSSANIVQNRMMSFGTFCTYVQPKQVYGLTTAGRLSGMMMDIDRLQRQVTDKDNVLDSLRTFIASQGPRQSANEHLVPEALFDNPATTEKEAEAVSAVKALQIAAQQGQKIFTITQANIDQVLPQLAHKALIIQDVKDAVAAGKIVTISQNTMSYKGWTGAGYILIDPNTGAGAYLIGGGADGGFLIGIMVGSVLGIILMTAMATGGFITGPVSSTLLTIFIPELVIVIAILGVYLLTIKNDDKTFDCFVAGFKIGLGLGGIFQAFGDIDGTWQRKIAGLILSGLGLVFGASDLYSANQECITND